MKELTKNNRTVVSDPMGQFMLCINVELTWSTVYTENIMYYDSQMNVQSAQPHCHTSCLKLNGLIISNA